MARNGRSPCTGPVGQPRRIVHLSNRIQYLPKYCVLILFQRRDLIQEQRQRAAVEPPLQSGQAVYVLVVASRQIIGIGIPREHLGSQAARVVDVGEFFVGKRVGR